MGRSVWCEAEATRRVPSCSSLPSIIMSGQYSAPQRNPGLPPIAFASDSTMPSEHHGVSVRVF